MTTQTFMTADEMRVFMAQETQCFASGNANASFPRSYPIGTPLRQLLWDFYQLGTWNRSLEFSDGEVALRPRHELVWKKLKNRSLKP